ncbi:MAG: uracil-DNA glycosylase, partial [Candidatus Riflebacteria bacterium]|nr:uracil-DNA glycosylase [Candidatus Riflebacteria bacterium]
MAKAKKVQEDSEESLIEAVDIVSLLSEPGFSDIYDREITQIECREGFELPSEVLPGDMPQVLCAPSEEPKVEKCKVQLWGDFKPIEGDTLEKVAADIAKCEGCDLCKTRKKTVPGAGSSFAKLMLIGEGPGADEDETGIPFVGKAGQHLDKILAAAGFKRDEVYICNIVKCRPPNNRDPKMEEMARCSQFLQRQIHLI